jgi:hypothetical protein
MSSYITSFYDTLRERHYIRRAGGRRHNYWFDFSYKPLQKIQGRFGDNFCLIIYASDKTDDAYILPYQVAKNVFTEELLDKRGRWNGYIDKDILHVSLRPRNKLMNVSLYYNRFDLLWGDENQEFDLPESIDEENTQIHLRELIAEFNRLYQNVQPHKKRIVSERIARPGSIVEYLKEMVDYTCEICEEKGFVQRNRNHYVEAHHINELHELIPGSYCSDNIIIVCPNCHKKLHFADVEYQNADENTVRVRINDGWYQFNRKMISNNL